MTYPLSPSTLDAIFGDAALSPSKRLLLLVLESHASSAGSGVYPSLRRLADRSGLSLAHVCTLLPELATDGYLTIHHRQGPKGGNLYEVHLPTVPLSRAPESGTRTAGAPASGTELRSEREKTPILFQPEELQPVEHQPPAVTPAAANWLRTFEHELGPHYAQVLQGAQEPPASVPRKPRGEGLYTLGKLCKRGHQHEGTGQSLRRLPSGSCLQCDLERQEAKRQANVQTRREARPPRRIIDLSAHRQRQGG